MESISYYFDFALIVASLLCVFTFYSAANHSKHLVFAVLIVTVGQVLAMVGDKSGFSTGPFNHFLLLVSPSLVMLSVVFFTKKGEAWLNRLDVPLLIVIQVLRAPIELIFYGLYIGGSLPYEMTLGGGNFDILAGLSAMPVYYYFSIKKSLGPIALGIWSLAGIGMLVNLFYNIIGNISIFGRPGTPLIFLPALIIPILLCSQLVVIRMLVIRYWRELTILIFNLISANLQSFLSIRLRRQFKYNHITTLKRIIKLSLIALFVLGISKVSYAGIKIFKTLYPERGFWVTEFNPENNVSKVRFYNDQMHLILEQTVDRNLNISRRTVRKYLNRTLQSVLAKTEYRKSSFGDL